MNKELSDLISSEDIVPCLFCPLKVLRSDMPRVGVCKICYAKAKRAHSMEYNHLPTWEVFIKPN